MSTVVDRAVAGPPADPASEPGVEERPGAWPLPLALIVAALSGFVLTQAYPGALDWWPLAPVAVAGFALATRGQRPRRGAGVGYVFGLCFFVPHLHWSGIYVGLLPWFALAGASAAFMAALGAALTTTWRLRRGVVGTIGTALAGGSLWVLQEALRDRLPFGGFPWGRLVFSQSAAPTSGLAAVGGAPLVTFAVALAGTLLALTVAPLLDLRTAPAPTGREAAAAEGGRWKVAHVVPPMIVGVVVTFVGLLVPLPTDGRTVQVAAVQGNVPAPGLDFNAERRAVLDNHARATRALAQRIAAGTATQPDLVLWPENSSDIDPLRNPDAAQVITQAVDEIKVPTLVGAVLDGPDPYLSNVGIVWGPEGSATPGPGQHYVKRHPAPFAEYIPYRSFFRHFSDKVDLVARDFISGDKLSTNPVGVMRMGTAKVGDVICFEVAYDGLVRDPVKQGADILAVQTNNATFGYSDESVQQLAMSRIRAIENGRTVVHVSTVGVSAIILPNGTVLHRSGLFTPDVLEAAVPLRTSLTLATRVGEWPEGILAGLGVVLLVAGVLGERRRARTAA